MGKTLFENGDITDIPSTMPNSCCGHKHYWDGKEYDNVPKVFEINVTLGGKTIVEQVTWFFEDSDPTLNSNSGEVAHDIVQRNFDASDRDKHVVKIINAIRSRLKDFNLDDDKYEEKCNEKMDKKMNSKKKSRAIRSDRTRVVVLEASKSLDEGIGTDHHEDVPSTSKRVVMKREADGTIKPPSPPVHHHKGPTSSPVAITKPSVMGEEKVTAQADSKSIPKASSSTVKVRVSTSNGRQQVLLLPVDLNYEGLRTSIETHFHIPAERQIIKHGFPPKLFKAEAVERLGLRNGDKIMVEEKAEKIPSEVERKNIKTKPMPSIDKDIGNLQTFVELLPKTLSSQNSGKAMLHYNVDVALEAVSKMASLIGKASVWDYAIIHPELFLAGGAFYQQFGRDIGLVHGRHCMLPLMPGRIFMYNGKADRIELCLEPTGHYEIGPDIPSILNLVRKTMKTVSTHASSSVKKDNDNLEVHKDDPPESTAVSSSNTEPVDNDGTLSTNENVPIQSSLPEESNPVDIFQAEIGNDENLTLSQPLPDIQVSSVNPVNKEILSSSSKSEKSNLKSDIKKLDDAICIPALSVTSSHETKMAPGFTTVGSKPTEVTPEQAIETRNRLVEVLKAKKENK